MTRPTLDYGRKEPGPSAGILVRIALMAVPMVLLPVGAIGAWMLRDVEKWPGGGRLLTSPTREFLAVLSFTLMGLWVGLVVWSIPRVYRWRQRRAD